MVDTNRAVGVQRQEREENTPRDAQGEKDESFLPKGAVQHLGQGECCPSGLLQNQVHLQNDIFPRKQSCSRLSFKRA